MATPTSGKDMTLFIDTNDPIREGCYDEVHWYKICSSNGSKRVLYPAAESVPLKTAEVATESKDVWTLLPCHRL